MNSSGGHRLIYGVHGYGRGHAVRAQAVLPDLTRRHEVLVLAGDEAYELLRCDYPVVRIPTLRYYHRRGRLSARLTLKRNTPGTLDLFMGGPVVEMVMDEMRRFGPDAVISDSEGWTVRAARKLGLPRINFDHYGVMAYCRLEAMSLKDRLACRLESLAYRALFRGADRIIATAFYEARPRRAGVRVVGPILRPQVRRAEASDSGHLLAYFSNAGVNFTPAVERALRGAGCPARVYGTDRRGADGNLDFRPVCDEEFLGDLAACRAVVSTAGNQLVSEAIHFGKPLLVMPEESLEQRLNARYVARWGIGMQASRGDLSAERVREFLARRDAFAAAIPARRRDGLAEALEAVEQAVAELSAGRTSRSEGAPCSA